LIDMFNPPVIEHKGARLVRRMADPEDIEEQKKKEEKLLKQRLRQEQLERNRVIQITRAKKARELRNIRAELKRARERVKSLELKLELALA